MALAVPVQDVPPVFVPLRADPQQRRAATARPPRVQPRLSVVIVNYRQWRETGELVGQLREAQCVRAGLAEMVVVDNHSPPDRVGAQLRALPEVSLRRWGRNRGFARAVNEGCRLGTGDWCLLLNPDTSVTPGFLDRVLAAAEALTAREPRTGIIGFQLRNTDGSLQWSSGAFPNLVGTLAGMARARSRRKYRALSLRRPVKASWVTGCCLLVRRDCLEDLRGFDEGFFLYYEDVDFCRRARARGWSVWYDPTVQVIHHRPLHSRTVLAPLRVVTRHALLHYASRHWPAWQAGLLARVVGVEARLRQAWARWRSCTDEEVRFAELEAIARDMAAGKGASARRRLRLMMRREERRGIA